MNTQHSDDEVQLACDAVAIYLAKQGYRVAQHLVGDNHRVDLVGRKSGQCVVAELQLDSTLVETDGARAIVAELRPVLERQQTAEGLVIFRDTARLGDGARQILDEAGVRVLRVDPTGGCVLPF